MNKILFTTILTLGLISLAACTDEVNNEREISSNNENVITFNLIPESDMMGTRAYGTSSHINQLIYKIYKWDDEENVFVEDHYFLEKEIYEYTDEGGNNKTIAYCGVINKGGPYNIRLIPNPDDNENPDQKYKIVCWAQYKDSPFFDLSNFPENITINYGNGTMPNNEETRDAFYCTKIFTAKASGTTETLILKRPFAQINIGTSGWDYEGFASIEPKAKIIKYSKIKIKGVAKSFSPFTHKASGEQDNLTTIEFDWAKIPAYRNLSDDSLEDESVKGIYTVDHNEETDNPGIFTKEGVDEEFLLMKLVKPKDPSKKSDEDEESNSDSKNSEESDANSDSTSDSDSTDKIYNWDNFEEQYSGFEPYIGWKKYDYLCTTSESKEQLIYNIFTETFKYLSMCYVLVPFEYTLNEWDEEISSTNKHTVDVEFDCSVGKNEKEEYEGVFGEGKKVLELSSVPVQSNCRTNILGVNGTGFFMNSNQMQVAIYEQTFADYYEEIKAEDKHWDNQEKNPNGDYKWPDGSDLKEDIDPDFGKQPVIVPRLQNSENTSLIDVENNIIHSIIYFGEDVKFTINTNNAEVLKLVNNPELTYEFYLDGEKLDVPSNNGIYTTTSNNGIYTFTFPQAYLKKLIEENNIVKSSMELEEFETDYRADGKLINVRKEVPDIRYYPFDFKVKTIGGSHATYRFDDLNIKIRLYTSYKISFSASSNDVGKELWENIPSKNHKEASGAQPDENGCYYLINDESAQINSGHIIAKARNNNNSNSKLFALSDAKMGDHLRFRGCSDFLSDKQYTGQYLILKDLTQDCKITVKMGRDAGQDNSKQVATPPTIDDAYKRDLFAKIGNEEFLIGYWEGYDPTVGSKDANKLDIYVNASNNQTKTTLKYSETKIMKSEGTIPVTSGEVHLVSKEVGYCVYWVILSEHDENDGIN